MFQLTDDLPRVGGQGRQVVQEIDPVGIIAGLQQRARLPDDRSVQPAMNDQIGQVGSGKSVTLVSGQPPEDVRVDAAQVARVQVREVLGEVIRQSGDQPLLEIRRRREDPLEDPLPIRIDRTLERMLSGLFQREDPDEEEN